MQDHRIPSAVIRQYRPDLRHILSVILRLLDDGTDPRLRYHLACACEIAPATVTTAATIRVGRKGAV